MKKLAVYSVQAAAACAASMFAVPAVLAQDAPSAKAGGLEEITVTARRREESLQDVPIAVSAFSAERIQASARRTSRGCSSPRRTSPCRSRAAPTPR